MLFNLLEYLQCPPGITYVAGLGQDNHAHKVASIVVVVMILTNNTLHFPTSCEQLELAITLDADPDEIVKGGGQSSGKELV